LNILSYLVDY